MDDHTPAEDTSAREDSGISVKIEPDPEEPVSTEDPLPTNNPSFTPQTENERSPLNEDTTFEDDLSSLLQSYRSNSVNLAPENTIPYDSDYEEAVTAVEDKRAEIASKEFLGDSTDVDRVQLKVLEGILNKLRKGREKDEAHRTRERELEDQTMFFPEYNAADDEIELTPAPSRAEAMNDEVVDSIDINDDDDEQESEQSPPRNVKTRGGGGSKSTARSRKPAAKAGSSRVQKRGQTAKTRGRGGRQGPTMVNIGSLLRNDIVADAAANQGAGEQPSFGGARNKKAALTALIASIPQGHRDLGQGERAALDRAAKQFRCKGQGSMQVKDSGWRLKGMHTSLKNFQLLGSACGCEREAGSEAPYGGMLADTMGYGKTVQMITIMVENQPKPKAKNRITLIVVPSSSMVDQWVDELAIHAEVGVLGSIIVHKSGSRLDVPDLVEGLKKFQIIITTYREVMNNYPKCEPPVHLVTDKAKDEWWDKHYHENKGPLLQIPFFRVILDEAQTIKNHESRTSKACRLLTAKYKWVLSGTPLSNCMEELFSYFNFLGVAGAGSYPLFKQNYAKRNDTTMGRLDAILRTIMIRHTGADRLLGKPLVSLPALDHQTIGVEFSPIERAIYAVVRQRFINRINDWSTARKIGQLFKNIFVMLLRLRQMCAHVFMVSAVVRHLFESEDVEKLWKAVERHSGGDNGTGQRTAEILKKIITEAQNEREGSATSTRSVRTPENQDNQDRIIDLTINDDEVDFRGFFYHLQRSGTWSKILSRSVCHFCKEIPEGTVKLSRPCGHLYCEECLEALLRSAEAANKDATCSECQGAIIGSADMQAMARIATEAGDQIMASPLAVQKTRKGKKKDDPDTSWLDIPGAELMSTKVQAIVSMLEKWISTDPAAKIVVFTFFLPMVKVFAKICSRKGWGYQEFTGTTSAKVRNQALKIWKDKAKGNKILLMSTRAGGLGLNLVEASYAVIVDPWWNQPLEDQAFSRIYRIGQERNCVVRRIVIKDAIDTQLMLHLQKLKAEECDRVIDGRSQDKLNVHDLMRLFGPTRRDPATNELIIENDQEGGDEIDEFVMGEDHVVVEDSDGEEVSAAPSRPQE